MLDSELAQAILQRSIDNLLTVVTANGFQLAARLPLSKAVDLVECTQQLGLGLLLGKVDENPPRSVVGERHVICASA